MEPASSDSRPRFEDSGPIEVDIWGVEGRPLVSVIVTGYKDPVNIRAAIASVQHQTLHAVQIIVVDDCSPDHTKETAEEIARTDPRITVLSTEANSGGPGGPRNVGLDNAAAPYVMFLDSDDVLERHACYNLLTAAEESGADLVMGRTTRYEVAKNRPLGWHARLYREVRRLESIEDDPEMAIDTIAVAKLYKKSFIDAHSLRFREDIHYEDLIFTATVFTEARGIQVIPEWVYQWNIYPVDVRKSITNQRDDIKNLRDRKIALKEVMRIADPALVPGLHDRLQLKVVRHDVRIYLNDIANGVDPTVAKELVAELKPLIESVPRPILESLLLADRLLMAATLLGDVELVRRMVDVARGDCDLYGSWRSAGTDSLWEPEKFDTYPPDSLERTLATFDSSELESIPWYSFRWFNEVDRVTINDANLITITGRTPDPFCKFATHDDMKVRAVIHERWGLKRFWVAPVKHTRTGDTVEWTIEFQFPRDIDLQVLPKMSIRMEFTDGAVAHRQALRAKKGFAGSRQKTSPVGVVQKVANIRYQAYRTVTGTLALRLSKVTKKRKKVRTAIDRVIPALPQSTRSAVVPIESHLQAERGAEIMAKFSGQRDEKLVVVESHMGQSQFDSPRAIVDELRRHRPDLRVVWSASYGQEWALGRDDVVMRHTEDYYRTLARASFIVDNQSLPDGYVKQADQVYVQTWHGIPIKRMGFDEDSMAYASKEETENLRRKVGYWDYLTVPSEYFRETFVPAFGYEGAQLPLGSPRNDVLVNEAADIAAAKTRLDLDPSRTSVLYAPTFRTPGAAPLELDLIELVEALGDDVQIMLRPHYLNRIRVPAELRANVIDVSAVGDTSRVLLASDILVSDYSSIIFDFLTLNRPVILYAYDLDDYVSSARGTYFDLRDDRPGPLVTTQDDLVDAIRGSIAKDDHADQRQSFRLKYAGTEPGNSARTTVETVWGAQK
ncbi:CDP-glycerol glycerophosphotransferase family protein [Brevibacterium sp.]|uniref:bifunctional glycosyltransferase/CDP-glycerol:glycerophosphate glycerophosphotransferase n=1 Tax=Brevibacterium sp. TaxID=1701 RepID=UPI002810DCA7|nr:CDP-glycerol glycerophosphotransferase family protein [Brevibacterium sp.]